MKMLERYYDEITKGMPDAERADIQAVNITAAADWFFSKDEWFSSDFPIAVPPFPRAWLEFRNPTFLYSGKQGRLAARGCLISSERVHSDERFVAIERDVLAKQICANRGIEYVESERVDAIQCAVDNGLEAGWYVSYTFFFDVFGKVLLPMASIVATLDTSGAPIDNMMFYGSSTKSMSAQDFYYPFFFAISLMHAKNVSLVDDPLPAPIAKRRAREGKPVITFKTLSIEPMRKQSRSEAPGTSGAKRAMHIVRGHFKDYREGGGLFGKMKGLYWWDMHVAGDAAVGTVVKDYKIGKVQP